MHTYAWARCGYGVWNSGCRVQDAGARRVSNAEGIRRIVRKRACALPAQYTKHSNARGHSLGLGFDFCLMRGSISMTVGCDLASVRLYQTHQALKETYIFTSLVPWLIRKAGPTRLCAGRVYAMQGQGPTRLRALGSQRETFQ